MSTIKVTNIEHASTGDGGIQLDNAGHVTVDGQQMPTAGPLSNRNLIINGAMNVAQRGTSETGVNSAGYKSLDRMRLSQTSIPNARYTHEQSTDAPDGFAYSLKTTTTTAEGSVGSGDGFRPIEYRIEGQDLQHLQYGTSGAKSLTLSFYVKSSVTGTYTVAFYRDESTDRLITDTYTISSANTWEYKTITIPGDTSASITNDNAERFAVFFHAGAGSNFTSTDSSGSWGDYSSAGFAYGNTVNLQNTLNATWQATGLQLEVGEKATPFEHRSYCDELQRCMRYYQKTNNTPVYSGGATTTGASAIPMWYSGDGNAHTRWYLPVRMRTPPSAGFIGNESAGTASQGTYVTGNDGTIGMYYIGSWQNNDTWTFQATETTENSVRMNVSNVPRGAAGDSGGLYFYGSASTATVILNAEL